MTNEIMMVDNWGQMFGISELSDEQLLKKMDDSSFEDLVKLIKHLKNPIKKVDAELKRRLDENGQRFKHVSYGETTRRMLPDDDDKLKQEFVEKYGWQSVQVKTPSQLEKIFGEEIQDDLSRVVITERKKVLKYV